MKYFAAVVLVLASFLSPTRAIGADETKLNVVLILVDDLGWMDLSCQGSDYYKTPNIDKLASEGMRFTNAYAACSVCSPTRAAVMTGRWPGRLGVTDWIRARFQRRPWTKDENPTEYVGGPKRKLLCPPNAFWMEHEELTIAELLKPAGYATCHIGKWHLGDPDWYPPMQGFDFNVAGCDIGQPPSYFDPYVNKKYGFDGQLEPRKKGEFLTHREGDEARKFITEHKDQPFFLYYCPYAVHTPIQAIPEVAAKYKREGKKLINQKYAALTESVDDAVGTIMKTLEETGTASNTLVIFTSDNGGLKGPTDNSPLRSGKGFAYEGGIRVPLIVRWPGVVKPGTISDEVVTSVDYFPTIKEAVSGPTNTEFFADAIRAAGGETDPEIKNALKFIDDAETAANAPIDGVSLVDHLKTGGTKSLDRKFVHWHFPHYRHAPGPYSIIRAGDWKLIRWYTGGHELYNLGNDLSEKKDLAASMPEKVKELDVMLTAELERIGAKLPKPNPEYAGK